MRPGRDLLVVTPTFGHTSGEGLRGGGRSHGTSPESRSPEFSGKCKCKSHSGFSSSGSQDWGDCRSQWGRVGSSRQEFHPRAPSLESQWTLEPFSSSTRIPGGISAT